MHMPFPPSTSVQPCANTRAIGAFPAAPLVTVGLPVHNGERHIARAIESVLAQSLGDFELIVSDNASTDGTAGIVHGLMQRDPRIRYRRFEANRGISRNWSVVVREARGRFFKWLSASDLMAPGLLQRCVDVLNARPDVVLAYGSTRWIDSSGRPLALCESDFAALGARPSERFLQVARDLSINNLVTAGVIRTEALRRTRLMGNYPSSDLVLMAELALQGRFVLLPEELYRRRTGADVSTPERAPLEVARMYDPHAARPRRLVALRRQAGRYAACLRARCLARARGGAARGHPLAGSGRAAPAQAGG